MKHILVALLTWMLFVNAPQSFSAIAISISHPQHVAGDTANAHISKYTRGYKVKGISKTKAVILACLDLFPITFWAVQGLALRYLGYRRLSAGKIIGALVIALGIWLLFTPYGMLGFLCLINGCLAYFIWSLVDLIRVCREDLLPPTNGRYYKEKEATKR